MKVIADKLGILKLKYTLTIICQTGFLRDTKKIMRSHDVIMLFFFLSEQNVFNAANSCFKDK